MAPQRLGLSTPRPADFDAFWDGKLVAQAKVPINAQLTRVETDVPGVELNMFVMDALGSKAHGYLAKPAKEGRFPALIQLQYAGVYLPDGRWFCYLFSTPIEPPPFMRQSTSSS